VGAILTGTVAVGGRIMKTTREQLFAAPKVARRAEERLERAKAAVSAARARATEIAQQCEALPKLIPTASHRRRLARLRASVS
jgi:citrate lyase synthetase